jgi:CheY-like chemotaxis protein
MSYKVLLVEDDEIDVMMVRRAFEKAGLNVAVHAASDGFEGLEKLTQLNENNGPILVLLDINMPGMNGIEFLERVRSIPEIALVPIIMMTSSASPVDISEAYKHQVAGYFVKPMSVGEMSNILTTIHEYWSRSLKPSSETAVE